MLLDRSSDRKRATASPLVAFATMTGQYGRLVRGEQWKQLVHTFQQTILSEQTHSSCLKIAHVKPIRRKITSLSQYAVTPNGVYLYKQESAILCLKHNPCITLQLHKK